MKRPPHMRLGSEVKGEREEGERKRKRKGEKGEGRRRQQSTGMESCLL